MRVAANHTGARKLLTGSLAVSSGDGAKELELGEEPFNQMASLVEFLVVIVQLAIDLGRDHGNSAGLLPRDQHMWVCVEALVAEQNVRVQLRQQCVVGPFQIASLSGSKMKSNGVAEGVDGGVNSCTQAALAASDGLL